MRFVLDGMLGRVALWLRLTGHDTLYYPDADDDRLIDVAQEEDRVLLTSDAALEERARDRVAGVMLVRGDVDEQVTSVFKRFQIEPRIDPSRSRCSKCNGELEEIHGEDKSRIRALLHEKTYDHYDIFWLCKTCNSVFFQGAQWKNITDYMDRIKARIGSQEQQIT